jgi:NTP pyrophosphatase (non-canonical NTP hydrolase)
MEINDLQKRALEIRDNYRLLEIKTEGKEWSTKRLVQGFLKDVSDLQLLVENNKSDEALAHELSDCLWCVLVLAKRLNIDIGQSFKKNMDILEKRIEKQLAGV